LGQTPAAAVNNTETTAGLVFADGIFAAINNGDTKIRIDNPPSGRIVGHTDACLPLSGSDA